MKRRHFLNLVAGATLSSITSPIVAAPAPRWDRILVLVELNGGNDGLNTVVPYSTRTYYRLRPTLAVPRDNVLALSEQVGLNPALQPLMSAWEERDLAIVQGVGYPDPNRSHFRSIEIWDTGSAPEEYLSSGWIARALTQVPLPTDLAADALVLGRGNLGALSGAGLTNIVMRRPEQMSGAGTTRNTTRTSATNPALSHVLKVEQDLENALASFSHYRGASPEWRMPFSNNRLSRQLENAADVIAGEVKVPVIKVSHSGFDTHNNQRGLHDRLLSELASGLAEFRSAMKQIGRWQQVLVMTYSEFGRRASENGSRGTDHGTAAPHFMLGGHVRGGLYAEPPSLQHLNEGDLQHVIDFRRLYATVTRSWWGLPAEPRLGPHEALDILT